MRDLGGLLTRDGATVRPGRIFRSDYPAFAEVDDGAAVRELGLATVVDLRRGTEAGTECVRWVDHRVAYHRCPLSAGGGATSWHAGYHTYLTHRPESVVEAVRRVADVDAHPVLFHCAAGKDRTGVIAAMVLSVLGVPAEQIVADYVLSEAGLTAILERLRENGLYAQMLVDSDLEDQRPRAENMHKFLAWLDEQGGAEQWLVEHGTPADDLKRFRGAMLGD